MPEAFPALLMTMLRSLWSRLRVATSLSTSFASETSPRMAVVLGSFAAAALRRCWSRPVMMILLFAPSVFAIANPMPALPPVMRMVLLDVFILFCFLFALRHFIPIGIFFIKKNHSSSMMFSTAAMMGLAQPGWPMVLRIMIMPSRRAMMERAACSALVVCLNSLFAFPASTIWMILSFQRVMASAAFAFRAGWVSAASMAVLRMGQPPGTKLSLRLPL